MKITLRRAITMISALTLLLGLVLPVRAELDLDFTLVNKTGYTIKEIYIGPTASDDWGDNIVKTGLKDGQYAKITFSPKAKTAKWDIMVVYEDGDKAQWLGYKLDEISKITLFWDADKQKSTAKSE